MKTASKIIIIALLLSSLTANAQVSGIKQSITIDLDKVGNATLSFDAKYNASMWDFFKRNIAGNNAILKQQVVRQFPKYVIENFDVKTDDLERNLSMKFTIPGFAYQDEKGKWKAALDSKNPDITKLTEKNYLLVEESSNQTMKINLPDHAENAKVEKDSFGNAFLSYNADLPGGLLSNILKYLGFLVIAAGAYLLYKNFSRKQSPGMQVHKKIVSLHPEDVTEPQRQLG